MTNQPKPNFKIVAGVPVEIRARETLLDAARRRYGRPFLNETGAPHVHTSGAAYWTAERIAALAAENEARRKSR